MGRNPNTNTEQTLGRKAEICLGVLKKKKKRGESARRKEKENTLTRPPDKHSVRSVGK